MTPDFVDRWHRLLPPAVQQHIFRLLLSGFSPPTHDEIACLTRLPTTFPLQVEGWSNYAYAYESRKLGHVMHYYTIFYSDFNQHLESILNLRPLGNCMHAPLHELAQEWGAARAEQARHLMRVLRARGSTMLQNKLCTHLRECHDLIRYVLWLLGDEAGRASEDVRSRQRMRVKEEEERRRVQEEVQEENLNARVVELPPRNEEVLREDPFEEVYTDELG